MRDKSTANHRIENLKSDFLSKKLKANLEYQRYNTAWGPQQKNSLIVSILQNYPIGEIIRNKIVSSNGISEEFEVVDGYQRTTAICEYMENSFPLNNENSRKIISSYLSHFEILQKSGDKEATEILNNFNSEKNIRLKFKSLPKTLQDKICNTEVSVSTLSNWPKSDVIEYFRRVQEGKPLSNADKLHTIQTDLLKNLKNLSSNENILNCLGLKQENGKPRKGGDRIVSQTASEAIYCAYGQSIGQPKKLDSFFNHKDRLEYTKEQQSYFNIINSFLTNLSTSDKSLFNQKSITTDLKLIFCLLIFGNETFRNYNIKDYKKFLINIVKLSGLLKNRNDKKSHDSETELLDFLVKNGLNDIYEKNKDSFNDFMGLRWRSHSSEDVRKICREISTLYKQTVVEKIEL
jgi:hypothetical protein